MVDFREEVLVDFVPGAIQVPSRERASGIAVEDAIWVHHRDYFEDVGVAELDGLFVI